MNASSRFSLSLILTGLLGTSLMSGELLAQDSLESKFLTLLEKRCQECHHPDTDDELPYLHQAMDLREIVDGDYVTKGDLENSAIHKRVVKDPTSRTRMPRSRGVKDVDDFYRDPLTEDEVAIIENWILSLSDDPTPKPKPTPLATTDPKPTPDPATPATTPTPDPTPPVAKPDPEPAVARVDPDDVMPTGLALNDQVHWIFGHHCGKCHSPGEKPPELYATVNLDVLLKDKDYVTLGAPEKSSMFIRVALPGDDGERMPKSKGDPGDSGYRRPLNQDEIAVLKKWIETSRSEVAKREIISNDDVIEVIDQDLRDAPEDEQQFRRYFTLTNLYNAAEGDGTPLVADNELNSHRGALSKLINSLSASSSISLPEPIDEAKTVYRIDLRDYEWSKEDWDYMINFYPYGILGIDNQRENSIEKATGTAMAYVRADWFAFAGAQPPLYHELINRVLGVEPGGAEGAMQRLEQALKVDRVHNLQEGNAIRAGFQFSGVSGANRLIERHVLGAYRGAYWISYDFSPLSPKPTQNLARAPLGPLEAHLTENHDHIFEHAGGEVIFNLPNGLQAYLLATAEGARLDRAPTEIVQDKQRADNAIINGISCMSCHDQGMKSPPRQGSISTMFDEIRPLVEQSNTLDFREGGLLDKLYVDKEELQKVVREDEARFVEAETEATGKLRGATEPVIGLYNDFRGELTARKLAAEFGMSYEELVERLEDEARETEGIAVLANQVKLGLPLRREEVLRDYISIAYALDFSLYPFEPLAYEDFGGQSYADLIRNSSDFILAFGKGKLDPVGERQKEKILSPTSREELSRKQILLSGGGKLDVSIQPRLKVGQRAELEIVASRETFVRAIHLSSDDHVTELFPGKTGQNGRLRPGVAMEISWETTLPGGPEHIVIYASERPIRNLAARGAQVAGDFKVMKREDFFTTRGIPKAIQASEKSSKDPTPARIDEARIGYLLSE